MGGRNHQPCRAYLELSTRLSRSISQANLMLEQGNIALEDLILTELREQISTTAAIRHHLQASRDYIQRAISDALALRMQMDNLGYVDLPEINDQQILTQGVALADIGAITVESWDRIVSLFRGKTFYGVLDYFMGELQKLDRLTLKLIEKISGLNDYADEGSIHIILETNLQGNFKIEFARLYTTWNHFLSDFLASSLISTTVWYLHEGVGTLIHEKQAIKV